MYANELHLKAERDAAVQKLQHYVRRMAKEQEAWITGQETQDRLMGELEERIQSLQHDNQILKSSVSRCTVERDQFEKRCSIMEKQMKKDSDTIHDQETRLDSLIHIKPLYDDAKQRISELTKSLQDCKTEKEKIISRAGESVSKARQEVVSFESQLSQLRIEFASLTGVCTQLKKHNHELLEKEKQFSIDAKEYADQYSDSYKDGKSISSILLAKELHIALNDSKILQKEKDMISAENERLITENKLLKEKLALEVEERKIREEERKYDEKRRKAEEQERIRREEERKKRIEEEEKKRRDEEERRRREEEERRRKADEEKRRREEEERRKEEEEARKRDEEERRRREEEAKKRMAEAEKWQEEDAKRRREQEAKHKREEEERKRRMEEMKKEEDLIYRIRQEEEKRRQEEKMISRIREEEKQRERESEFIPKLDEPQDVALEQPISSSGLVNTSSKFPVRTIQDASFLLESAVDAMASKIWKLSAESTRKELEKEAKERKRASYSLSEPISRSRRRKNTRSKVSGIIKRRNASHAKHPPKPSYPFPFRK
ncbi:hypothetical protein ADUPG1_009438 [Aduncisulcus paluster]|uniref:Uncharacterized protein n=1 Tax=Aduncisulcus paluster TaxID=2918883 RepID=A0ABQ5KVK9_9EUKA|nr:hypothetical protein ADUPG1_009438 [Aduncisulcus paluster]